MLQKRVMSNNEQRNGLFPAKLRSVKGLKMQTHSQLSKEDNNKVAITALLYFIVVTKIPIQISDKYFFFVWLFMFSLFCLPYFPWANDVCEGLKYRIRESARTVEGELQRQKVTRRRARTCDFPTTFRTLLLTEPRANSRALLKQ